MDLEVSLEDLYIGKFIDVSGTTFFICLVVQYGILYCTLIVPLCSISHKANRPISSDIGWLDEQVAHKFMITGAWCMIYNKFLIGWVAIQYH